MRTLNRCSRRRPVNESEVPHLRSNLDFHPARNQTLQKLAFLSATRIQDLCSDVLYELTRRHPEFKYAQLALDLDQQNLTFTTYFRKLSRFLAEYPLKENALLALHSNSPYHGSLSFPPTSMTKDSAESMNPKHYWLRTDCSVPPNQLPRSHSGTHGRRAAGRDQINPTRFHPNVPLRQSWQQ